MTLKSWSRSLRMSTFKRIKPRTTDKRIKPRTTRTCVEAQSLTGGPPRVRKGMPPCELSTYTTYVACRYHVAALAPAFRFGSPLARKSYRTDESIGNIFTPTHASLIDSLTHSLTLSLTYDLGILLNGRNLLAEKLFPVFRHSSAGASKFYLREEEAPRHTRGEDPMIADCPK